MINFFLLFVWLVGFFVSLFFMESLPRNKRWHFKFSFRVRVLHLSFILPTTAHTLTDIFIFYWSKELLDHCKYLLSCGMTGIMFEIQQTSITCFNKLTHVRSNLISLNGFEFLSDLTRRFLENKSYKQHADNAKFSILWLMLSWRQSWL